MPKNNRFREAAIRAQKLTNKQLATEIAAISSNMDREKVQELFPVKQDKEDFLNLMAEVDNETTDAEKVIVLQKNLAAGGTIILKALKLLI